MEQHYKTHCYKITLLTNMHAGKGDANFGIIDNLVQRDHLTNYPAIYSSSLKGALREYFEEDLNWGEDITTIFGTPPKGVETNINGKFRFMNANLLFLPVRSSVEQYLLVTVEKNIISEFLEKAKLFNLEKKIHPGYEKLSKICSSKTKSLKKFEKPFYLEDITVTESVNSDDKQLNALNKKYDDKIVVMSPEQFQPIVDSLPVIARNQLENGESKNLWYEEVVPHHSVFYTYISCPIEKEYIFEKFDKALTDDNSVIQIGANASIGYGLCKFERLDNYKTGEDKAQTEGQNERASAGYTSANELKNDEKFTDLEDNIFHKALVL